MIRLKMWITRILINLCFTVIVLLAAKIGDGIEFRFDSSNQLSSQSENPKILFRHVNRSFGASLFLARANAIIHLDAHTLSVINERIIGPSNFSIFCFGSDVSCASCSHYHMKPLPPGYSPDNCGPRLTDAFVKTWATSNSPPSESASRWTNINNDFMPAEDSLYVCYNTFHGYCERLKLSNISIAQPWKRKASPMDNHYGRPPKDPIPVVNWNVSLHSRLVVDSNYLYVGIELDAFQEVTLVTLDSLSVRMRDFDYARKEPSSQSSLKFRSGDVRIQYKFSFQYTVEQNSSTDSSTATHIYFVMQQPRNTPTYRWTTRIARICSGDLGLDSYTELEIACADCAVNNHAPIPKTFDALHLASRGTIGAAFARTRFAQLSASQSTPIWRQPIPMSNDFTNVLLVAFAPQLVDRDGYEPQHYPDDYYDPEHAPQSNTPRGTEIVIYTMAEVDVQFGIVIQNCLIGKTSTGPPHFVRHESSQCVRDSVLVIFTPFEGRSVAQLGSFECGQLLIQLAHLRKNFYCPTEPLNSPISGSLDSERLLGSPTLNLDVDVTGAATTMVADEFTVLVVTTDKGELQKYVVEEDGKARLFASKQLTLRRRPLRELTLDDTGLVAFAVSDEKVYRVELYNCSSARSCAACLEERDPYCGWCVSEGRCTHKGDCRRTLASHHQPHWLSYFESPHKCPVIIRVIPPGVEGFSDSTRLVDIQVESLTHRNRLPRFVTLHLSPIVVSALSSPPLSTMGADGKNLRGNKLRQQHVTQKRRLSCAFRLADGKTDGGNLWAAIQGTLYARTAASSVDDGTEGSISCQSPEQTELPQLKQNETSKTTLVWLEIESAGGIHYPLAAGLFTIYECKRLTTCRSCSTSQFGCVWCLAEGRCLSTAEMLRHGTTCAAAESLPDQQPQQPRSPGCNTIQNGSKCACPSFTTNTVTTSVQRDEGSTVVARLSNLHIPVTRFSCSEGCGRRRTPGLYNLTESTVTCTFDGVQITAPAIEHAIPTIWHSDPLHFIENGIVKCDIQISWHNDALQYQPEGGHPLTNSNASTLEVYDCGLMAAFCDSCLLLPEQFRCVWCEMSSVDGVGSGGGNVSSGSCVHMDRCTAQTALATDGVRGRGQMHTSLALCPNPRILQISPENATLSGQTAITIRGVNLGAQLTKIKIGVVCTDEEIGSVACIIVQASFRPSRQVTCQLQPVLQNTPLGDPLKCLLQLSLIGRQAEIASHVFTYLTPRIYSFSPLRGPIAGGTLLKITGQNLNVGNSISVVLVFKDARSSAKCEIISIIDTLLVCRTSSVNQMFLPPSEFENMSAVRVESVIGLIYDNIATKAPERKFLYTPNPVVRSISRSSVFFGGGCMLRMFGQYLDSIEHPLLVFYHKGMEFIEPCRTELGQVICVSPSLELRRRKRSLSVAQEFRHQSLVRPITNPAILSKLVFDEPKEATEGTRSLQVSFGFIMDNVTDLLLHGTMTVLPNPEVFPFPEGVRVEPFTSSNTAASKADTTSEEAASSSQNHQLLRFPGNFKEVAEAHEMYTPDELSILIGWEGGDGGGDNNHICKLTAVKSDELRCDLDRNGIVEGHEYPVTIKFGRYIVARPGSLQFKRIGILGQRDRALIIAASFGVVLILIGCFLLVMWCRSRRMKREFERRFEVRWAEQEKCVARVFKNDFMELQMHMEEVVQDLNKTSLPIRDYETYCIFFLFPEYHLTLVRPTNPHDNTYAVAAANYLETTSPYLTAAPSLDDHAAGVHPLISPFLVPIGAQEAANRGIFLFNQLLGNRHFLFLLVRAIEGNREIDARAKSHVASYLSVILQPKMEYQTHIILLLISDLLRKSRSHGGDNRLLTAFRRAESVVAKMLSNWFTFLLYNFIKDRAGEQLFILYRALLQQINTGPRDAVTGYARYTLDALSLLKSDFPSRQITLCIVDPDGLFGPNVPQRLFVRLLSCDTITQSKEKILDAIYRTTPYSMQLRPTDIVLEKRVDYSQNGLQQKFGRARGLLMSDCDLKIRRDSPRAVEGPPYRLNCLSDYKLVDNDVVAIMRSVPPPPPSVTLTPCAAATLQHPCPPTTSTLGGDMPSSWDPSSLPGSLFRGSPYSPSAATVSPLPPRFHIQPTGAPDPHLWYHLEKPTVAHLQVPVNVSQRQRGCPNDRCGFHPVDFEEPLSPYVSHLPPTHMGSTRRFTCCLPNSKDSKTLRCQSPGQFVGSISGGDSSQPLRLDAASLRRWLATDTTDDRARAPLHRRRKQRKRLKSSSAGKTANGIRVGAHRHETVELTSSCCEDAVDFGNKDRSLARLPCEMFLNRLLCTRVSWFV